MKQEDSNAKNIATYVLALSLFCLAGALVFFSLKVAEVSQSLPMILQSVEHTTAKVEPVLAEVNKISDLVPPILEEAEQTRLLVPPVLEEIKKTRESIPPILNEIKQTREQVPAILNEVSQTRAQIPAVLHEVEQTRKQIPAVLDEVAATREIVPDVLEEVEKTRQVLPPMLDQAEKIVADAGQIGKKASEDAVAGVFTGIVKAPFKIIGGIGKSLTKTFGVEVEGITEEDRVMIAESSEVLLATGVEGESKVWSNPNSGNEGVVTFVEKRKIQGRDCTMLHYTAMVSSKKAIDRRMPVCLNAQGEWELAE